MTVAVQRTATVLLALLALIAAAGSVLLGDVRPIGVATGAAGTGLLVRWAGRQRLLRFLHAAAVALAVAIVMVVAYLLLPGSGADPSEPRVSVRYSGQVDATGPVPALTETMVWDEPTRKNLQAAFPRQAVNSSTMVPPRDWRPAGSLDGAPVYTRTTSLAPFGSGWFGVDQATVRLSLGRARLDGDWFEMVPAEGSPLAIRTRKGALGNSDPAAENIADLPGRPALQNATIRVNPLRGPVTVDVLGSALRNPAGRMLYDAWSWGWLSWLISGLVLICAAVAADLIKERIRTLLSPRVKPASSESSRPPTLGPPDRPTTAPQTGAALRRPAKQAGRKGRRGRKPRR